MSDLPYLNVVGDVAKIGMCLTILTNFLVIYLTFSHIKSITGPYKWLIVLLAGLGLIFSIMESFVHPFLHSFNASFTYFSVSPMLGTSRLTRTCLLFLYSVLYSVIICVIAIQFAYRYLIMKNSSWLEKCRNWHFAWWLVYILCCVILWVGSSMFCLPKGASIDYVKREMWEKYNCEAENVPGLIIVAYNIESNIHVFQKVSIICIIGPSTVLIIQYLIIIYCGLEIRLIIHKQTSHVSRKRHSMQRQLFATLVLQISAPSIFHHVPVFLLYAAPYLNLEWSFPSGVMISVFCFYPAIDSVILMWMVTEYQRAIGKLSQKLLRSCLECVRSNTPEETSTVGRFVLSKNFE